MKTIRVFFKKTGNIRYISHLDTQRAMIRALMRSGLDIVYSEGFNPHPKIVFAQPLSIYQESEYEIFDFKLNDDTPLEEVRTRLTAAMPDGIEVFKVADPVKKLSECAWAKYKILLTTDKSADEIKKALSGGITVLKKTKTKELYCDIAPQIKELSVYAQDGKVVIETVLPASGNNYLNPNYIADFLSDKINDFLIRRIFLYDSEGKPLE